VLLTLSIVVSLFGIVRRATPHRSSDLPDRVDRERDPGRHLERSEEPPPRDEQRLAPPGAPQRAGEGGERQRDSQRADCRQLRTVASGAHREGDDAGPEQEGERERDERGAVAGQLGLERRASQDERVQPLHPEHEAGGEPEALGAHVQRVESGAAGDRERGTRSQGDERAERQRRARQGLGKGKAGAARIRSREEGEDEEAEGQRAGPPRASGRAATSAESGWRWSSICV
jgi:hypothetical protein